MIFLFKFAKLPFNITLVYFVCVFDSALKINDHKTLRRLAAAEIFKTYDGPMEGRVKISNFNFIFRDLVANRHISTKLLLSDVHAILDEHGDGYIYLNKFISWIDTVSYTL